MKIKFFIIAILVLLSVLFILLNQYLQNHSIKLTDETKTLKNEYKNVKDISNTNRWIKENIIKNSDIEKKEDVVVQIITLQDMIKDRYDTTILEFDKENKNYVKLSLNIKLYKDDIEGILDILKLKIDNGIVLIDSLVVNDSIVDIKLSIIKYCKE